MPPYAKFFKVSPIHPIPHQDGIWLFTYWCGGEEGQGSLGWCPVLWILADIYRGAEPVWSLCWSLLWCYVPSALWGDIVISYLPLVQNELLAAIFASQPQASLFRWHSQNICVATVRSWAILGLQVLSVEYHDLCLRFLYLLACCCHFHSMTSLFTWRVV